jgi:hypothetical protein
MDERFSSRPRRTVNSNGNLGQGQYMQFMEKSVSEEHILAPYQNLLPERLEVAKKHWKLYKKQPEGALAALC